MFMKKVLVSALFAAGMIGALAAPLSSVAQVEIQLNFAPPVVRYEAVPAPRTLELPGLALGQGWRRRSQPPGRGPQQS